MLPYSTFENIGLTFDLNTDRAHLIKDYVPTKSEASEAERS